MLTTQGWFASIRVLFHKLLSFPKKTATIVSGSDLHTEVIETSQKHCKIRVQSIYKSTKDFAMSQFAILKDILQKFVSATPDVQGAALVTPDGLPLTSVLPSEMDEERTAAMSAAMLSLGERIGQELSRGMVERLFVEGEKGYSVLVGCGNDAVLLVLADKQAKQGILFLEIKRLAAEVMGILG